MITLLARVCGLSNKEKAARIGEEITLAVTRKIAMEAHDLVKFLERPFHFGKIPEIQLPRYTSLVNPGHPAFYE